MVRAPDGTVERVVETKAPGDATELELHIQEVNTGCSRSTAGALLTALGEVRADNAQGELYLPDVLPILREHERTVRRLRAVGPATSCCRSTIASSWPRSPRWPSAQIHERHMLAGVTIVNPDATVIDAGVEIGPTR